MVNKYDTEAQGALRIEFSNRGKYLAVACTMEDSMDKKTRSKQKKSKYNKPDENSEANPTDSKTIIKIFDVEDQKTN